MIGTSPVHEFYRPFRNYMRRFPLNDSLLWIWAYSEHLARDRPLPNATQFVDAIGRPTDLRAKIFAWELELLARELVLNASASGDKSLGRWPDLRAAINHIRRIEEEISKRHLSHEYVLRELHRIAHHQFPWQAPLSAASMMRYYKVFGTAEMDHILKETIGVAIKELYLIGLAASCGIRSGCSGKGLSR
jgi:hypothetical protein